MKKLLAFIPGYCLLVFLISCQKEITITAAVRDSTITPPADSLLSKIIGTSSTHVDTAVTSFLYNSNKMLIEVREDSIAQGGQLFPKTTTKISRDGSGKITRVIFSEFPFLPDTSDFAYQSNSGDIKYKTGRYGTGLRDSVVYQYKNSLVSRKTRFYYDPSNLVYNLDGVDSFEYDLAGNIVSRWDSGFAGPYFFLMESYTYDSHKTPITLSNTENHALSSFYTKNNQVKENSYFAGLITFNNTYSYNAADKPLTLMVTIANRTDTIRGRYFYKL